MKRLAALWSIIPAVLLAVGMALPAEAQGVKKIKIGVIGPMKYVQGQSHWNGALMAADEINAKGGVQVGGERMKIELVKADSNESNSITDAANAMERLISRDKVDFVVGGFRSEAVFVRQLTSSAPGWPTTMHFTSIGSGSPLTVPLCLPGRPLSTWLTSPTS